MMMMIVSQKKRLTVKVLVLKSEIPALLNGYGEHRHLVREKFLADEHIFSTISLHLVAEVAALGR